MMAVNGAELESLVAAKEARSLGRLSELLRGADQDDCLYLIDLHKRLLSSWPEAADRVLTASRYIKLNVLRTPHEASRK
jgi:hypothetical protein